MRSTQLWIFFDGNKSPTMEKRRTSIMGRKILSLMPEKAYLALINMNVIYLGDTARDKAVTVSPRHFFPTFA